MEQEHDFVGIGRRHRRLMVQRWKESGTGLSLKAWARTQHPVGDAAYIWWRAKGGKEQRKENES